jgi:hypothetical protein
MNAEDRKINDLVACKILGWLRIPKDLTEEIVIQYMTDRGRYKDPTQDQINGQITTWMCGRETDCASYLIPEELLPIDILPDFCNSMSHAYSVMKKMQQKGYPLQIKALDPEKFKAHWKVSCGDWHRLSSNLPHAICTISLQALGDNHVGCTKSDEKQHKPCTEDKFLGQGDSVQAREHKPELSSDVQLLDPVLRRLRDSLLGLWGVHLEMWMRLQQRDIGLAAPAVDEILQEKRE